MMLYDSHMCYYISGIEITYNILEQEERVRRQLVVVVAVVAVQERITHLTDRPILLSVLLGSAGISASPVCGQGNSKEGVGEKILSER